MGSSHFSARSVALAFILFAMTAHPGLAQERMIAVHADDFHGADNAIGAVSRINQGNANVTILGTPLPGVALTGVATNSAGRVFAATGPDGDLSSGDPDIHSRLIEINPVSGTLLNDIGRLRNAEDVNCYIDDLSFQPGTDILFGIIINETGGGCLVNGVSGTLVTIDTSTALVTVIGKDINLGNSFGGIAFAADGTLYFTPCNLTSGVLLTLDPATGLVLTNTPTAAGTCYRGLAVRPSDGALFGSFGTQLSDFLFDLVRLNPINGNATLVGLSTPHFLHDLTFMGGQQAFVINQGLNDAWFNPDTNGQGFFIIVFEDIPLVFLAWFTYDTERPDGSVIASLGDAGHRWITAQGGFVGDTATLDIVVTRGGVFDASEPAPENTIEGSMEVVFASCTGGIVKYDLPDLGLAGEVPIQRIANDNVALCEKLSAQ